MFIRKKTTKGRDYYQLVASKREGIKVVQSILLCLGTCSTIKEAVAETEQSLQDALSGLRTQFGDSVPRDLTDTYAVDAFAERQPKTPRRRFRSLVAAIRRLEEKERQLNHFERELAMGVAPMSEEQEHSRMKEVCSVWGTW